MAITLEAIRAAGGIVHSDGNIFFRDISMLQGLAGAAPAAVAGPAWDKTRDSLATLLLGLARRPFLDFDVACIALDAATEPGMPLAYMRSAPAAPALEAPAAPTLPAAYQGGMFATTPDGGTVTLRFSDASAGEQWFERLTDGFDALAAAPQAPAAPSAAPAAARLLSDIEDWLNDLRQSNFDGYVPQNVFSEAGDFVERIEALPDTAAAPAAPAVDAQAYAETVKKAARYDWLRDFHNGPDGVQDQFPYISAGEGNDSAWALTGVTADTAIDAAIAAQAAAKGEQP